MYLKIKKDYHLRINLIKIYFKTFKGSIVKGLNTLKKKYFLKMLKRKKSKEVLSHRSIVNIRHVKKHIQILIVNIWHTK